MSKMNIARDRLSQDQLVAGHTHTHMRVPTHSSYSTLRDKGRPSERKTQKDVLPVKKGQSAISLI